MRLDRRARWAWVVGMVALCVELNAQGVDLSKDERLQKPITVREPLITLKQLLTQVGKELNVGLFLTSDIAEDKVCVFVRERPAHEVLQRLADVLRYEWQPSSMADGYRLYQPHAERVREQQLRAALWQARRQGVERALRILIDLARRVRWEELTRLGEEGAKRLSPEQARLLPRLYDASVYAAARVMGDFRATEWQRFWQGEPLVFSSAPRAGELPLAPELSRLMLEGRFTVTTRASSEPAQDESRETVARLRLHWDGWRGELSIATERESYTPSRNSAGRLILSPIGLSTTLRTLSARELTTGARSQTESTALLDDHPLNKVWREWANVSDRLTPARRTTTTPERIALPDYLQRSPLAAIVELATRYGLDLYADAYRLELFLETLPATRTLLLNKTLPTDWSEIRAMFWLRQEDDALLARHKDYFWLRPSEIPEESLRLLEAKKQKCEVISLDDWARFADSLNELQIERLMGLPLLSEFYVRTSSTLNLRSVTAAIPALRFWASLTPQQKQVALSGEPLFLRRLSLTQQQRFQQALYAPTSQTRFVGINPTARESVLSMSFAHFAPDNTDTLATHVKEPHFMLLKGQSQIVSEGAGDASGESKLVRIAPPKPSESAGGNREPLYYLFRFAAEAIGRLYLVPGDP